MWAHFEKDTEGNHRTPMGELIYTWGGRFREKTYYMEARGGREPSMTLSPQVQIICKAIRRCHVVSCLRRPKGTTQKTSEITMEKQQNRGFVEKVA